MLPNFKAVHMRSNPGTLLVSCKHVQLPALAPDAWPNPPGAEEVSAAEAEQRKQAKKRASVGGSSSGGAKAKRVRTADSKNPKHGDHATW